MQKSRKHRAMLEISQNPGEGCHAEHTLYLSLIFLLNYAYIL